MRQSLGSRDVRIFERLSHSVVQGESLGLMRTVEGSEGVCVQSSPTEGHPRLWRSTPRLLRDMDVFLLQGVITAVTASA